MIGREAIDHILRAAGEVTGHRRFVLVGSAAIFAWRQVVPDEMLRTREADVFALDVSAEEAERIAFELDASLGQASLFDETFGYHCDGVGPETAILPAEWQIRAVEYGGPASGGVTALVPHPDDLCASKLCAGRPKDIDWVAAALRDGIVREATLGAVLQALSVERRLDPDLLAARLATAAARP